jgi:hypothetical protein
MDSTVPHVSERILSLLGENKITFILFQAHAMNVIQVIDLVFLAVLKKIEQSMTVRMGMQMKR